MLIQVINNQHVKDAGMSKKQLQNYINFINVNYKKLAEEDGFEFFAKEFSMKVEELKVNHMDHPSFMIGEEQQPSYIESR
jgi:hypothetical protein